MRVYGYMMYDSQGVMSGGNMMLQVSDTKENALELALMKYHKVLAEIQQNEEVSGKILSEFLHDGNFKGNLEIIGYVTVTTTKKVIQFEYFEKEVIESDKDE